jgi:NADPH2:quinone reductase
MKAILIEEFGGPEALVYREVPRPTPKAGEVTIRVHAFGVNHAEMHMRRGEWDEWNAISGLECVGVVDACPGGELSSGTKVVAVMGGMGRSRPGSYGELVNVPITNVIPVNTSLPWYELAALPEVYCTAWSCLFTLLDLQPSQRLLIRGATSTIGQAAVHLAVDAGAVVTATTRREDRFQWLRDMGVADVKREEAGLAKQFVAEQQQPRFDKILNLVGNSVLVETFGLARQDGGWVCQAGWLGGLDPVKDFNPMVEMPAGVHLMLFHSKVLGSREFPLEKIPFQRIVTKIEQGAWDAKPKHLFEFGDIHEAHRMLDSHNAGGKIVVKHPGV